MDYLQNFVRQFRGRLVTLLLINNLIIVADWWIADRIFQLAGWWLVSVLIIVPLLSLSILPWITTCYLTQPTKLIWQAILHIAPGDANIPAPDIASSHLGKDLVTYLNNQVYQLASSAARLDAQMQTESHDLRHNPLSNILPVPFFVLDKDRKIVFASDAGVQYVGLGSTTEVVGKKFYGAVNMSFQGNPTLDVWLDSVDHNAATANHVWERVRLDNPDLKAKRLFDLATYYNKDNPQGYEIVLVLFDHTETYNKDEQAMSYVALAVHELRNPLTLLRGYIEAAEEDVANILPKNDIELLHKIDASAQQLATVVNNVLNVARIEEDQFQVTLQEEHWDQLLRNILADMELRASVRGIHFETDIAPTLPTVGVDRVSIYEVISNLIDNAIKYSTESKKIMVHASLNAEGEIETSIQDFGAGIPQSIMPNLFDKFYRGHRSRAQIGGTGLGLFLCKTIVTAHGGSIWVRSKEGEGAVFSFTVLPYNKLTDDQKTNSGSLTRVAHGWIKNHSLYRR